MLNSTDSARIGKAIKRLNPGKWDDLPDEDVAAVHIRHGQFDVDGYKSAMHEVSIRIADITNNKDKGWFFENFFREGAEERRARISTHQLANIKNIVAMQQQQLLSMQQEYEMSRLPEVLAARWVIEEARNELTLNMIQVQQNELVIKDKLAQVAATNNLTTDNFQTQQMETFRDEAKVEVQWQESRIKRTEQWTQARIEIYRKKREAEIEAQQYQLQADALDDTTMTEEAVRAKLFARLERLVRELRALELNEKDPVIRQQLMEDKQFEIDRLRKQLRGLETDKAVKGKEDSGPDDGGSGGAPKPGSATRTTVGTVEQSHSSKKARHIN